MSAKRTYVATAPDGTEHTRTTATRFYEYAILTKGIAGRDNYGKWGIIGFSGDRLNADKTANQWRRYGHDLVVVTCQLKVKTIR